MSIEQEKTLLLEEINAFDFDYNCYKLALAGHPDRFIFGVHSTEDDIVSKIVKCRNIFLSIKSSQLAIRHSLLQAMNYAYHEKVNSLGHFHFLTEWYSSDEEFLAYYYLDNAIFRVSSMWDMLAQLYNIIFDLGVDIHKIYYEKFFKSKKDVFKEFKGISDYLDEQIPETVDYESKERWKGNHKYLHEYRNMQTHIKTKSLTGLSNLDINIKDHPIVILKHAADEYYTVCGFIQEALQKDIKDEVE